MNLTEKNIEDIRAEWNTKGSRYVSDINKMVEFGETNGWENWKGKEPEDKRDHLAEAVFQLLKDANKNNTVDAFRNDFPPAHAPMVQFMKAKAQSIQQLHFIDGQKIVFLVGTAYQKRQAYLLKNDEIIELDASIDAIGKSKQNNVFAIASNNTIVTTQGWEGDIIATFHLHDAKNLAIAELVPFNDGQKVLLTTAMGIFIIANDSEKMIHPLPDPEDEEWEPYMDMENATISNDNKHIVVGDQCSDHRVLDANGTQIGEVGPQSSYPDFCLFSKDDNQLIINSCHFYNGVTIGIPSTELENLNIPAYEESEQYTVIDEEMRVYCGIATSKYYILGDAFGNIRAIDTQGNSLWRYYLGSSLSGIAISDDEKTLWVGSSSGMLHKLQLDKGLRDDHTIATGKHYEDFRLVIWKDEPILKW